MAMGITDHISKLYLAEKDSIHTSWTAAITFPETLHHSPTARIVHPCGKERDTFSILSVLYSGVLISRKQE